MSTMSTMSINRKTLTSYATPSEAMIAAQMYGNVAFIREAKYFTCNRAYVCDCINAGQLLVVLADYEKDDDKPAPAARLCEITEASMEDADGRGDGAYDLLDVEGTPEEIGAHIADALALGGLGDTDLIDEGKELFLTVRIKIKKGSA